MFNGEIIAATMDMAEIGCVVYCDNPILTLDRLFNNIISLNDNAEKMIKSHVPSLLQNKLWIEDALRERFGKLGSNDKLYFTEHHVAHEASAFYPSPFKDVAILTTDGVGEWAIITIGKGHGNEINILKRINYPHSLGLLYCAFTFFGGFKVNSGDYKFKIIELFQVRMEYGPRA